MLVKILHADPCFVAELKIATSQATASRAYAEAANQHFVLASTVHSLQVQVSDLQARLDAANQVIKGARTAAARLFDKTASADIS